MNRRNVLAVLTASAAGLATLAAGGTAFAAEGSEHEAHFEKCAKACADCQIHCDSCFHHCAELMAKGDKDHAKAMHACVDCGLLQTCRHSDARNSPFAAAACECCAKCNDECAAACEKFADDKKMAMCARRAATVPRRVGK